MLMDANEWHKKLVWPDVDAWDWAESARKNQNFLDDSKFNVMAFQNGWFERLISLMDFSGASLALIDEEQINAVKDFFDKLTDTYIKIFDYAIRLFPMIDGFWIHDDWGGQMNTFFSPEVCHEMIVPYMKRATDYLHSRGKNCDFHSCGMLIRQVPNMIAAGWDSWTPQWINDTQGIYDLYGDKIIIGVTNKWPDPGATAEEQQQAVAGFVKRFCNPDKPCTLSDKHQPGITPLVREELIKLSIIKFNTARSIQ
jgi:hypothetical protein